MKKITLLLFMCLAFSLSNAQQTISFETSEGYASGNINTQNGWVTTGDGTGGFIMNQVVSNEQASDGSLSLKIDTEGAFAGQANPIVGAFYNYVTAVPHIDATFSADMFIDTFDSANTSDYIFGFVNITDGVFVTYVRFTFEGNISVLADDGAGTIILDDTMVDWTPLTWFNVRIEMTGGTNVDVFIDDVSIYSGLVATPNTDIEQVRFAHDNFAGFAHIDNFRTNDEPTASVNEFDTNTFTHSYNKDTDHLKLTSSSLPISGIELFSVLGQRVMKQTLSRNDELVNMSNLNDGIYLAKINIQGKTETIKILKQ
ncbi:T9SS type A sorting domain-containing protein [Psychroserpens mesophilus]|uniref:T9SS type A sorting domain-containing protein n=1 Tax=Psychroserpens mesophilus TaxID=325473 RepID=UPI00058C19F5|nr:T9SS type A sorting domain-containing protein [Psychroserpens mesophilus]